MPDTLPPPDAGWTATVRAFVAALRHRDTYAWHRNPYAVFGLCWGLPIPLVTLGVECVAAGEPLTWRHGLARWWAHPWHWWFAAHPLLFGIVFGALGTLAMAHQRQAAALLERLRVRADTDGLTGLLNHRAFQIRVREETTRAVREHQPISLLFVDIDHFKALNDRHGHQAGDRILADLALRLRALVRPYDIVARYGGEEFAIILPGMDADEAAHAGERVRAGVADRPFTIPRIGPLALSCSVGVATREPSQPVGAWLRTADQRLYRAKRAGRDRVCADA